ncbi:MAG: energy transducer TonB [FCB group bacterium]|nr:energy transducer TonB [FCB group bacterium]MBL7028924.1 energy transducer TonB [Candidatus Neomarinimicrobiota bacterium]MBL7122762.1 energy transducer TonB [Candidatus Neomarinimicrobiota bacterium]
MLTQYPWVSVKNQERKHIEIGAMVTLLVAIISFYSIPDFGDKVIMEKAYVPPPVEMINIPATLQPPEVAEPLRPGIIVESEIEDVDVAMEEIFVGLDQYKYFKEAPPHQDPTVPFEKVEVKPFPVGGWGAIGKYVVYPPIAIEARQEGKVIVKALIGKDGIIKEVKILEGLPGTGLDEAAMAAVLQTPFEPAYQRDKPVLVWVEIPIDFKLR